MNLVSAKIALILLWDLLQLDGYVELTYSMWEMKEEL